MPGGDMPNRETLSRETLNNETLSRETPSRETLAKICGLTRQSDAEFAESLGADFLGAIMAGGPRNLSVEAARNVLGKRRHGVRRAIVFGTQSRTEIARIANDLALDVVQLHGDPSISDIEWLRQETDALVWPVVRVAGVELPPDTKRLAAAAGWVLLDTKVVGQLGGTGVALDWQGLRSGVDDLRLNIPGVKVILAGGLRADNLSTARAMLDPDAVDVSSGVEDLPGIKNPLALAAFITAARTSVHNG